MSRALTTFDLVMKSLAVSCDYALADVTADSTLQEKLMHRFNRAWKRCWEAELWEDAPRLPPFLKCWWRPPWK